MINAFFPMKGISSYLKDKPDASVIVPTLNEEGSIGLVLEGIREHLPNAEVIVVDSSDDRTAGIASSMGAIVIRQAKNGYGAAIRAGLRIARGRVLAFMDGDGTYDPRDLKRLVNIVGRGETDIATGLRFGSKPAGMSIARYAGNLIINIIFSLVFIKRIKDTQTGMKVFSRDAYLRMNLREEGMPFSTEVLTEAFNERLRIKEVRINYHSRIGISKLNVFKDGLKILLFMLRKRLQRLRD